MRASRILAARPERTIVALAQLCEERESEFVRPLAPQPFVPPRLAPIPAQTPYSVGSNTLRPKSAAQDRLSPPPRMFESSDSPNTNQSPTEVVVPQERDPPEHMAPRRSKWTSPPPPDDPDHVSYESRLGLGISLATSSSTAREPEPSRGSSSSNSEILTDEDVHDKADLESVGSFTSADGQPQPAPKRPLSFFGPSEDEPGWLVLSTPKANKEPLLPRGRTPLRFGFGESGVAASPTSKQPNRQSTDTGIYCASTESPRRSSSGPPAPSGRWPAPPTSTPLPPSPPDRRTATFPASIDNATSGTETPNAVSFSSNITSPTFTSVRTPFPLYQQMSPTSSQPPLTASSPSTTASAPSNAFTAQHPVGATDTQSPSTSSRRSSWQRITGTSQSGNGTPNTRHSPTISPISTRRASKQPVIVTMPATHTSPTQMRTTSPASSPIQRLERESSRAAASSPVQDDPTHLSPTRSSPDRETSSLQPDTTVQDSLHSSMERLELTDSEVR
jgi:terminal uridylyltransferase